MIRLLAVLLLIMAYHSTVPLARAAGPAMPQAVVMAGHAQSWVPNGSTTRCTDGRSCAPGCAACNLPGRDQLGRDLQTIPVPRMRTTALAGFDLSWLVYRPPKARARHPDDRGPIQHEGTQDA